MHDTANAFITTLEIEGAPQGPLAGLTFAAKDIFDVAGYVTGCGSPDWAATHPPATAHAAPVTTLLEAGARLVGKTHTDEIAYSLMGANVHFGTPINSAAPDRVPGGSSSGSVAAVAAGLVEIGLGSDTGGSIRLPASFCGVYGLRTTHGLLSLEGTMPLAPSFDTVGWFTRDIATLDRIAAAFELAPTAPAAVRLLLPVDAWTAAGAVVVAALAPAFARLEDAYGPARPLVLAPEGLPGWFDAFRICQAAEIWQTHGGWIEAAKPTFGPGIADRFRMAAGIGGDEWAAARAVRARACARLLGLFDQGAIMVLPTSPGPAPLRDADNEALDRFRGQALQLLCSAGLAGLPQLSIPAALVEGAPVGLSLVGARGADRTLIAAALAAAAG